MSDDEEVRSGRRRIRLETPKTAERVRRRRSGVSYICGATPEDGRPGPSRARSGDRWKGDGYRCAKHGGGYQCRYEKDGVRCDKHAQFNGIEFLYCCKHQAAEDRCVDCRALIKYQTYWKGCERQGARRALEARTRGCASCTSRTSSSARATAAPNPSWRATTSTRAH